MDVQFSRHALEKMRRRNLETSHVHQALKTPDEVYEDLEHGTMIALKKTDEKTIVLAYKEEAGVVNVITFYYTTKLDRLIKSKTVRRAWRKTR